MTDMERNASGADGNSHFDAGADVHHLAAGSEEHQRVAALDAGHPDAPIGGAGDDASPATLQVDDGSSGQSTPRFIQDERASKAWSRMPYPVRRMLRAIGKWSRGPANPQPYRIKPLFPIIQDYPLFLVERFLPRLKHRVWLIFFYFSIWLITVVLVKRQGTLATDIAGWGQPQTVGCGDTYWDRGNRCGLNGNDCRPFNGSGFAFSCPANCESFHVLNPRAVGDQEVIYRSLVVGGPSNDVHPELATYRGDSFLCGAAIHAGIVSNKNGGCGVVQLVGQQKNFISTQRNGITSVGFDSYFPLSFRFVPDINCSSKDTRWSLLAISTVFTGLLSLFTASPALFFFPTFTGIFWTVGMALDSPPNKSVAGLFSNLLGKFLPAMFCAWVMYDKMGIRRILTRLTAQVEKTILWLGACWVGAMDNYTLSFIPIQRLTGHDLNQQPGAKAALSMVIIVLVVIVAFQVWFFRQEGRFIKYIKLYSLLIAGIIIALLLPGLNLRLHHYILALLLLPGTSLQTRPSLLYQGLLVGLFINGIARWGFDPVLQTSAALQGDAQKGSILPTVHAPVINLANSTGGFSNITFSWDQPTGKRFDGISVLVNDVERFRSYFDDRVSEESQFVWTRKDSLELPEYFRFAFMDGSSSGDYTKAGVWAADGEWKTMKPGPSKVKARGNEDGRRLPR